MKNKIKYIFIATILVLFSACKKEYTIYDGPTVVEFSPAISSKSQGTTAAPGSDNVKVQLVGAQRATDLELNYIVDPSSTAVEGVNYTIPNKGKFTVPANSNFGFIKVNLIPGSIPSNTAANQKKLVLVLTGSTEVAASANYKTYTLTITF
jgi:hypothetical protein